MERKSDKGTFVFLFVAASLLTILLQSAPAHAYVYTGVKLEQADLGDPITVTYSYSNLLDGGMGIAADQLRAAVEEGFGVWAKYAPLNFVEMEDSGPLPTPDDAPYVLGDEARIRIGHHYIDGADGSNIGAHTFLPFYSGLGADIHFDDANSWSIGPGAVTIDFEYIFVHELGHALGLGHEPALADGGEDALMNPSYPWGNVPYSGLGTAMLYPDDIAGIQSIYGAGVGSVTPLPEPATLAVIGVGTALMLIRRRK